MGKILFIISFMLIISVNSFSESGLGHPELTVNIGYSWLTSRKFNTYTALYHYEPYINGYSPIISEGEEVIGGLTGTLCLTFKKRLYLNPYLLVSLSNMHLPGGNCEVIGSPHYIKYKDILRSFTSSVGLGLELFQWDVFSLGSEILISNFRIEKTFGNIRSDVDYYYIDYKRIETIYLLGFFLRMRLLTYKKFKLLLEFSYFTGDYLNSPENIFDGVGLSLGVKHILRKKGQHENK